MNSHTLPLKLLLFSGLLLAALPSNAQKSEVMDLKLSIDSGFIANMHQPQLYFLDHSPGEQDKQNLEKYKYLLTQQPSARNYNNYYELACSLWKLNKLKEAEQLFLNIINSSEAHYSTTWHYASGTYGYGSYTSSYKNDAAIHLAKIYITNKQFDKAFSSMEDATKKYPVTYSCGTAFHMQKEEYDFLYAYCYEGLKKYDEVLELLLPKCLERGGDIVIRVIKEKYNPAEIKNYLSDAEASMQCQFDTFPSYSYQTRYNCDKKAPKTDTLTYYSGSATVLLLGKTVGLAWLSLEDGERVTKERFIKAFRESSFYTALTKQE